MTVTNDKLYDLVDQTRRELSGSIVRVEGKVDAVVSGPLAQVQDRLNKVEVNNATLSTKVYALVFIISTTVSAIITAVALKILGAR